MISIPGYQIEETLYRGSHTTVYRGRRESDASPVLLKVPNHFARQEDRARFHHQRDLFTELAAAGACDGHRFEEIEGRPVLVTADSGGVVLEELITASALDLSAVLALAIRLAEHLAAIHECQIIHKDVHPRNLLVDTTGGQVQLLTASIATRLPRQSSNVVNPRFLEGLLPYVSPEQTGRMNRSIDYRTDLYSLGVTCFQMLTGSLPFDASDPMEIVHSHIAKTPPRCSEINPAVPAILSDIVSKLLAKNAEDRYQSGYGLASDLEACREALNGAEQGTFELGRKDFTYGLQIPQKLYGREHEIERLLDAFERVGQGGSELMLVSGYSGIGKSALIYEINKPIVQKRGYFIVGKYESNKQDIPYFGFTQAFTELVRQLLTESAESIDAWRRQILEAVAGDGQVIIEVIPELELVIGPQEPVAELSVVDAGNRFSTVFQRFLGVFAARKRPLVVFLDDLQWADPASLKLIEPLVGKAENRFLFLIGTYRDNEVDETHPLTFTIDRIRKADVAIESITLSPLALEHVTRLVTETLRVDEARAQPFARLLLDKTGGNPFFLAQFLRSLYEESLLDLDRASGEWAWDVEEIEQKDKTANVIDLMVKNLRRLTEATQEVLRIAACVGNRFSLHLLSEILERGSGAIAGDLWGAIEPGFVVPIGDNYQLAQVDGAEVASSGRSEIAYRFVHDRIHAAAYSLNSADGRRQVHHRLGHILLAESTEGELEEQIFEVVNHLNASRELIDDRAGRRRLAELNLQAGKKAHGSTAFELALQTATIGVELLGEGSWDSDYELTLELMELKSGCEYLLEQHEIADRGFDSILAHARTLDKKIEIYTLKSQLRRHFIQYEDAARVGIEGVALCGIEIPAQDDEAALKAAVQAELPLVQAGLEGREVEDLIDLPLMTDADHLALMSLLEELSILGVFFVPSFVHVAALKMLTLSLEHGYCAATSSSFTTYGMFLTTENDDAATGYRFGRLAFDLSIKHDYPIVISKCGVFFGAWVHHWRQHLRDGIPILEDAYVAGLRAGDPAYSSYAAFFAPVHTFYLGHSLDEAFQSVQKYMSSNRREGEAAAAAYREAILTLQGGEELAEYRLPVSYGSDIQAEGLLLSLQHYYNTRIILHFVLGDYASALKAAEAADSAGNIEEVLYAQYATSERFFFHALVIAACYTPLEMEARPELLEALDQKLQKLQVWSGQCRENFHCKASLVAAEKARLQGEALEAMPLYDEAIAAAQESGFVHVVAIANELAARFYSGLGRQHIARAYLSAAGQAYLQWGAKVKVDQLSQTHRELLAGGAGWHGEGGWVGNAEPSAFAGAVDSESLDLATVMKASQAMSREIVLGRLLQKMMKISLENAGAEKGVLVLLRDDALVVQAQGSVAQDEVAVQQAIPVEDFDDLPASVIDYVRRTGKTVVLDDAAREGRFQHDSYIAMQRTKSILCMAIERQGLQVGILYLENKAVKNAFTPDRVHVLRLLSSQVAISLENATLYDTLEQKVVERTQELQSKNRELEDTLERLQEARDRMIVQERLASLGSLTAGIAHEIKNPLNFVNNFAQVSVELSDELGEELGGQKEKVSADDLSYMQEILDDLKINLTKIGEHGTRADGIIKSMLEHSRGGEGQVQPVDLNDLVGNYVNLAYHGLKSQNDAVDIDFD
ncbi:MAG: AAA family ATPase, partial [Acidobacteriota bacterium]